jgi:hypothetical protein
MKRIIVYCLFSLIILTAFTGCSASKKNYNELKGLMLLENVQLGRNKAFNSKHNTRARKEAYKRYRKNNREMNARRN